MKVAIFDFDGTLYAEETFYKMMDHLKHHPRYHKRYAKFMRQILPPYVANKAKVYPTNKMRSISMQIYLNALHNLSVEEVDLFFYEAAEKMKEEFNEAVVEKVKEHAAEGMHVMIVSGAYTPLLHEVVRDLPVDKVIGTDIPVTNGRINTKVPISHIQGLKKNEEIMAYLADEQVDWKNSYAYGDSYSDLSVLSLVGHPVAVVPDKQLKAIAERRDWEIIS